MRSLDRLSALVAILLLAGPALAYDPAKAPSYGSPDFYRPNVDRLTIQGPGSTGDVSGMSVTSTGAAAARTLAAMMRDSINLLDEIGPDEDASTGLNRAIAKAAARGGGRVLIPNAGTPYTLGAKIVLRSGVALVGLGRPTLRLAGGVNDTVIEGESFTSLTGTNSGAGIAGHRIAGLLIDGNAAANTAPPAGKGHCVAFYGRDFILEDLYLTGCARRGLHTEYGDGSVGTSPFNGRVHRTTITLTREEGWWNNVSDAHVDDVNVSSASQAGHALYDAIYLATHGGIRGTNLNVWKTGVAPVAHRYSLNSDASGTTLAGVHLETAAAANLRLGGGGLNLITNLLSYSLYGSVAGNSLSPFAAAHVVLESNANQLVNLTMLGGPDGSDGVVVGAAGKPVSSNSVTGRSDGIKRYVLNLVNSARGQRINLSNAILPATTLLSGAMATTDTLDLSATGDANTEHRSILKRPGTGGSVTPAGTDQAGATLIDQSVARVFSSNAASGVRLPPAVSGYEVTLINNGGASVNVYPAAGAAFLGQATNAPLVLPSGGVWRIIGLTATAWAVQRGS